MFVCVAIVQRLLPASVEPILSLHPLPEVGFIRGCGGPNVRLLLPEVVLFLGCRCSSLDEAFVTALHDHGGVRGDTEDHGPRKPLPRMGENLCMDVRFYGF